MVNNMYFSNSQALIISIKATLGSFPIQPLLTMVPHS